MTEKIAGLRLPRLSLSSFYQDSLRARFAQGVFWSIIGAVISQGFNLAALIAAARLLGQTRFGELGMINSTVVLFGVFAGGGLGVAATKFTAELKNKDPERAGRTIRFLLKIAFAVGGSFSIAVFLFASEIASGILNAPNLTGAIRLSCGLVFLNALNVTRTGALAGFEAFKRIAQIDMAGGLLNFILILAGAWFFGLEGAIGGYVVSAIIIWVMSRFALGFECRRLNVAMNSQATRSEWSILRTYALPAVFVSVVTQPFTWLVRVLLANQPNGYVQLGIFTAAFSWSNLVMFLPQQISRPSMPILSSLYGQGRAGEAAAFLRSNLALNGGLSLLIAVPLMFLSPYIMRAYGESFGSGWLVLVVISGAYSIAAGTLVFRDLASSSGKLWLLVLLAVLWGVILTGASALLMGHGALGLAFAYLIAYAAFFAIQFALLSSKRFLSAQTFKDGV